VPASQRCRSTSVAAARTERTKTLDLRFAADGARFGVAEESWGESRFPSLAARGDDPERGAVFVYIGPMSGRALDDHSRAAPRTDMNRK